MRFFVSSLMLLVALLPAATLAAGAGKGVAALHHFYQQTKIIKGHFVQKQYDDAGKLQRQTKGQFVIARPLRFRWDYESPYHQVLVSDGEKFRLYDVDLAQVTVRPVKQALQGTPLQMLLQGDQLEQEFTITDDGQRGGLNWVLLTPNSKDTDFTKVRMGFAGNLPEQLILHDRLGQSVHIEFSKLETPRQVAGARFQLNLPKGVEIVEGAPNAPANAARQ